MWDTGWGSKETTFIRYYQGGDTEEERARAFLKFGKETLSDNQIRRETSTCRHQTPNVGIML